MLSYFTNSAPTDMDGGMLPKSLPIQESPSLHAETERKLAALTVSDAIVITTLKSFGQKKNG